MYQEKYDVIHKFLMGLVNTDFCSFMECIFEIPFENIPHYQIKLFEKKWKDGAFNIWFSLDLKRQENLINMLFE